MAAVRAKLLAVPGAHSDRVFREGTLHGLGGVEKALQAAIYDVLRQFAGTREAEPQPGGGRAV